MTVANLASVMYVDEMTVEKNTCRHLTVDKMTISKICMDRNVCIQEACR